MTRLRVVRPGLDSRPGQGFFFLRHRFQTGLGSIQSPIECVPGILSPGIKQSGREADELPPCSAEIKNAWNFTSTSSYFFMELCSVKCR